MESYIDFVSRLINATDSEAFITPNYRDCLSTTTSGLDWITHDLDSFLPAYEDWLSTNNLPPIIAWNGADTRPWDVGEEYPLSGDPLDNPMIFTHLNLLGKAFIDGYDTF